jgi:hypothetical protein
VRKLKCDDFDKLLHLYLDGETEEKSSKEIEEHLLTCQTCSEKLRGLKNLEIEARRIKLSEPSPAYWESFTRKVRDKIILRRRKSIWAKIKSGWESLFIYSPSKLRIAAGIASVLLVFIIGKLYWDYKGSELERIRTERMEKALSPHIQEELEKPVPVVKESLLVEDQKEIVPLAPATPPAEEKVQSENIIQAGEDKTQASQPSTAVTAEKPKIEEKAAEELTLASQTELANPPVGVQETTVHLQEFLDKKKAIKMATEQTVSGGKRGIGLYGGEGIKYYKVDDNWVRALNPSDTLVEVDTLKKVITSWSEFFKEKPESEWIPEGFSQIKIAYQLLFLKTGEESILKEGIELLDKFKESAVEQKIKDEINKKITELEALKKR